MKAQTAPPSDQQPDESTDIPPLAICAAAFLEKRKWVKRGSPPLEIGIDGSDPRPIRVVVDEIFSSINVADLQSVRRAVDLLRQIDRAAAPYLAEIKKP